MVGSREDLIVELAGTEVALSPEGTVFWEQQSTLFVADLHLGKGSAFRAGSVPVPSGSTQRTLDRLCAEIRRLSPERIVILGDLWHAMQGRTPASEDAFIEWRNRHSNRQVWLVEGNHDVKSGTLPTEHRIRLMQAGETLGPFTLLHEPQCSTGYGLAGHLHPAVRMRGRADQGLTAPCFWMRKDHMVLPAFGEFTGCARITATQSDRVFILVDGQVREV